MWLLFHFVFMFFCTPSWWMHLVATFCFLPLVKTDQTKPSLSDVTPCLALAAMYLGFYLTEELYHFGFLPWWVTTICGFRKKRPYILFGGIVLGIMLMIINSVHVTIGHVLMNLGRMLKIKQASMLSLLFTHLILAVVLCRLPLVNIKYIDLLAGVSAVVCACIKDNMNWFSIGTLFTHPLSTGLSILHLLNLSWYQLYENNHFKRVRYSFHFLLPIGIVCTVVLRILILSELNYRTYEVNIPAF